MKSLIRHGGLWVLLLFCWLPGASGQTYQRVAGIVISNIGPPAVSEELARANIRLRVGDLYVRVSTDDDVANLYKTGYFFNIKVDEQQTPNGVVVIYTLEGKLKLTNVKFEGNTKYSNEKLYKKISSKIGEPLDEQKLFQDSRDIEQMYEKAGYPATKVKYAYDHFDQAAGRSGVVFEITESLKIKIVTIDFTGAKAFSQDKLRKVLKTRRHWMWSWLTRGGYFKADQFEDDKDKLNEYYKSRGYIDFEIKDVKITNPTPRSMKIEFVISEGSVYKVGRISFKGAALMPTNVVSHAFRPGPEPKPKRGPAHDEWLRQWQLVRSFDMKEGDVFTPDGLKHDTKAVADYFGSMGYIPPDPGQSGGMELRANRIPNTDKGTMDLAYEVDPGEKSYIEKIEIKGNNKTKDKVIRRELAVSPGDTFDMVRVQLSKERLEGLDYFEKVDTRIEPTVVPNRRNLVVGVDEKSTGQFTFGAGFNTVDSIVGFAQIEQKNFDLFAPPYFTGGGQKFRLRVQLGSERQDYLIAFVEPWFLNRKLQLGVDLYHSVLDFQSQDNLYNEQRTGMRLALTRALWSDFLVGSVSYNLEDIGIVDVNTNAPNDILASQGHNLLHRFGTTLAYDTRNNATLPNRGQRTSISESITVGSLEFFSTELQSVWYFPGLATGHVLEVGGKIRVTERLSSEPVPFYDRYYLGGQYDLRGYDYRAIGPRQVTQDGNAYEPVGGDTSWFGSAEYSIPIMSRLRLAVFYDIGNVSSKPFNFSSTTVYGKNRPNFPPPALLPFQPFVAGQTGTYSDNWGIGLRLNLPIGPLRLDYGIPLTHDNFSTGSGKFQFGVGFTRPF